MLRHVVLLSLSDSRPHGQAELIQTELMTLVAALEGVLAYSVGIDAGISEGNATIAVVGDFRSADDYRTYASDSAHLELIATHIKPWLTDRSAIQYEL